MFHESITLAQIANEPVECWRCGWRGLVKEAIAEPNAVVLCPRCERAVDRVEDD